MKQHKFSYTYEDVHIDYIIDNSDLTLEELLEHFQYYCKAISYSESLTDNIQYGE